MDDVSQIIPSIDAGVVHSAPSNVKYHRLQPAARELKVPS